MRSLLRHDVYTKIKTLIVVSECDYHTQARYPSPLFSDRPLVFKDYAKLAIPPISSPCVAHEAEAAPSNDSTGGYDKKPRKRIDNIWNGRKKKAEAKAKAEAKSKKDG